jgi:SNF2 family DNA or RNA helicase
MKLKFKTKPWKHQKKALKYLMPRNFGALYTDMGSGKTKVFIDLTINKGFGVTLIVTTKKICERHTWETEFSKHSFSNEISVLSAWYMPYDKRPSMVKEKLTELKNKRQAAIIMNYDSVWREPFRSYLLKNPPDCIICDESHRIKSPGSKVSKFLYLMGKKVKNRYILTGTPSAESPLDVYAQYRFLEPSIFGTNFANFKAEYTNQILIPGGFTILDKKNPYKNLDKFRELMFSCAFMEEIDQDLPPVQDIVVEFDMSQKAQKYYKEMRKEGCLELKNGVVEANNVLAILTRLQQINSGYLPVVNDDGEVTITEIDNSRQEAFKELLEGIPENEPVVVFAKYKKDIKDARKIAKELGRKSSELSGSRDTMQRWVDGNTTVLVIQISSGAEGLNELVRAKYCIYYSLHHSLVLWRQSRKRLSRPGQTRPVIYYTLVAKMKQGVTVDEKILKSLENKQSYVDIVMNTREL